MIKGEWDKRLRGNGTPPSCDVFPFKINNENDFSLIDLICTKFDNFHVAQAVNGQTSNPWVAGSSLAPVLLFISLVKFYKCIFGANVIVVIRF